MEYKYGVSRFSLSNGIYRAKSDYSKVERLNPSTHVWEDSLYSREDFRDRFKSQMGDKSLYTEYVEEEFNAWRMLQELDR